LGYKPGQGRTITFHLEGCFACHGHFFHVIASFTPTSSVATMTAAQQLVVPGQVIAVMNSDSTEEQSFLRGHGTYVEKIRNEDRLIASVCGTVQRVNKLITVVPFCELLYQGHVGDLVIGRVSTVQNSRWTVQLVPNQRDAQLPLSGVHLQGGAQRVRTTQDQRDMRLFLQEGDLISAEVHKVQPSDGALMLHTRSFRYSKLENGCLVRVPPALIARRKNHALTLINGTLDVLWGTNGLIWIQRALQSTGGEDAKDLADLQEDLRYQHANTPILPDERLSIARLRNAIECLRLIHSMVTPEMAESIYHKSVELEWKPYEMLEPQNVLHLTELCRQGNEH
jgi:exosome complex component RRP4